VKLVHSSAGFSDQGIYLDRGGDAWCEYEGSKMSAVALP
jgi:hypothetical protein